MTIRAILFDLGDTVFGLGPLDTNHGPRIAPIIETARHLPAFEQHAEQITAAIQAEMRDHSAAGRLEEHAIEEQLRRHAAAIGVTLSAEQVAAAADAIGRADTIRFLDHPGLVPRVQSFRDAGFRIGFVSNTTTLPRLMVERLDAMGLHGLFDGGVFSSAHGWKKPHASIYEAALRALDALPTETLFVGDRIREDVTAPKSLGMRGVLTHEYRKEDPSTGSPDAVISSLSELHAVIARLNR